MLTMAADNANQRAGRKSAERRAGKPSKSAEARAHPIADLTEGESALLAAIARMPEPDRSVGHRIHEIIRANAPGLTPRTWYGMPAYSKEGSVVCYFRGRDKFKERYITLGFNDEAHLDEGNLWPIVYAITELTPPEEARVAAIVKRAVG